MTQHHRRTNHNTQHTNDGDLPRVTDSAREKESPKVVRNDDNHVGEEADDGIIVDGEAIATAVCVGVHGIAVVLSEQHGGLPTRTDESSAAQDHSGYINHGHNDGVDGRAATAPKEHEKGVCMVCIL